MIIEDERNIDDVNDIEYDYMNKSMKLFMYNFLSRAQCLTENEEEEKKLRESEIIKKDVSVILKKDVSQVRQMDLKMLLTSPCVTHYWQHDYLKQKQTTYKNDPFL